ncbi:MAG: T9SS type A sorting domain-containing protein [candidate division KSB1 bacterium]|nr:T9SS type A sorting domain-containing protein [candidate division KSB1 bacterium]MDZ7300687.1 T9SS type A sorting domain-containing protein [candidate division KSB1 bacterium]MDZ7309823.1 T9SS type A sorting domain-containing protein [candidate division KSB1 bacterium]
MKLSCRPINMSILLVFVWAMSQSLAQNITPSPFPPTTVTPIFDVNGAVGSPDAVTFWNAPDLNNSLMFVTGPSDAKAEMHQFPFGNNELAAVPLPGKVIGSVADSEHDRLYVRVGKEIIGLQIPGFKEVIRFGSPYLGSGEENPLDLCRLHDERILVYTSEGSDMLGFDTRDGSLVYRFSTRCSEIETFVCDGFRNEISIHNENGPHIDLYTLDGTFITEYGVGNFQNEAEGATIYSIAEEDAYPTGEGYILFSEENEAPTRIRVFRRSDKTYLGLIEVEGVGGTDGMGNTQQRSQRYPMGVLAINNGNKTTAIVPWDHIFRRTRQYSTSSVGQKSSLATPSQFELKQNHPNPFNPSTTIEFALSEHSVVSLSVYDLLGNKIATLVEGALDAGSHHVQMDAKNLSSGIYVYRLEVNGFSQVKKFTVMK